MRIRPADADDIPLLIRWGYRRHLGSAYARVPFSSARMAKLLARLTLRDSGLVLIAERQGELVGGLVGEVKDSAWMDAKVGALWSVYIDGPKGRSAGLALLRRYVTWASGEGAQLIEANNSASMPDEDFVKMMQRLGFVRSGSHMHWSI